MKNCVVCTNELSGLQLKYCSGACKQKDHYHRLKSQTNTYHSQSLRAYKRKIYLIELFGGGCRDCSYKKNISALHFHHLNPEEKEFQLDVRNLSNRTMNSLLKEAKKCVLLCGNCHSEEHYPECNFDNIKRILEENSNKKSFLGVTH